MAKKSKQIKFTVTVDRSVILREIAGGMNGKLKAKITDKELIQALSDNLTNFFMSGGSEDYFRDAWDAGEDDFDVLFESKDRNDSLDLEDDE